MIRAVIIEDEFNALNTLKQLIGLISIDINIVGESDNVDEAILLITNTKPELIFLDIELIGGNAFTVLEACKDYNYKVVFTTAYDYFAIKAFKFDAFDYLLKPIDPDELETCLFKLNDTLNKEKEINKALGTIRERKLKKEEEKLLIKTTNDQHIINICDIIHCQSDGSYTTIYTANKQILTSRNLKYYENILNSHLFFRIHQSHLVNLKFIKSINSKNILTLNEGTQVPVSIRKKNQLKELLKRE